jgi:hypothetical protein
VMSSGEPLRPIRIENVQKKETDAGTNMGDEESCFRSHRLQN